MILLDFSQACVAVYMISSRGFDGSDTDLQLFRHSVLNSIRATNSKFRSEFGELVIAVDCRNESWRKQIFPYYKAARIEAKKSSAINWQQMSEFINIIYQDLLRYFPYRIVQVDGAEGDDVIGVLTRREVEAGRPVLICSADRDYVQLQIGTDLVKQWDNIHQKWVMEADPAKYLFEHVVKGDRGDGVPNVFSADDHFITKTQKAPAIRAAKLQEWWENGVGELTKLSQFKRNIKLIDLRQTPKDLQQQIVEVFDGQSERDKSKLLNYFIQNGLRNLTKNLGDF